MFSEPQVAVRPECDRRRTAVWRRQQNVGDGAITSESANSIPTRIGEPYGTVGTAHQTLGKTTVFQIEFRDLAQRRDAPYSVRTELSEPKSEVGARSDRKRRGVGTGRSTLRSWRHRCSKGSVCLLERASRWLRHLVGRCCWRPRSSCEWVQSRQRMQAACEDRGKQRSVATCHERSPHPQPARRAYCTGQPARPESIIAHPRQISRGTAPELCSRLSVRVESA
jgi:hypothetical protein